MTSIKKYFYLQKKLLLSNPEILIACGVLYRWLDLKLLEIKSLRLILFDEVYCPLDGKFPGFIGTAVYRGLLRVYQRAI